jgi:replicative DNA helicase
MSYPQPTTIERPVPYNVEAEEAVLGSMLMDPDAITKVVAFLKTDDFYREKHVWIYEALLNLNERDEPVDTLTVSDELERLGRLSDVGGPAALTELFMRVPTAIHVEYYGRIVERNAILRRLIGTAEGIAKLAYQETDADIAEIMDRAEAMLFAVSQRRLTGAMIHIKEALAEFYDQVEHLHLDRRVVGLQTTFTDLDRLLGGFQRGDLIIVAARPAMGKSALSLSIMEQMALKHNARIAFFSLEMGVEQLVGRLVSSQTGIDVQRLRVGPIYEDDLERIGLAVDVLGRTKVFFDETPSISPLELRTKARRVASEHGLDLIIVDYLQLMRGGTKNENRVQEISFISRALKGLARELRVPVIALSQLSRGVETRQDKRPMLSDLRESGSIEQDADVVMFIYRDEVYNKNSERPNIAELIIAKHRNGPTGTIELRFTRENAKFGNLETFYEDDDLSPPLTTDASLDDIVF